MKSKNSRNTLRKNSVLSVIDKACSQIGKDQATKTKANGSFQRESKQKSSILTSSSQYNPNRNIQANPLQTYFAFYKTASQQSSNILKKLQTYQSHSQEQLKRLFQMQIQYKRFKSLIIDAMKLDYLFKPLVKTLQEDFYCTRMKYKVKYILVMLLDGQFYRHLFGQKATHSIEADDRVRPNLENFVSQKSTSTNIKCIIACLLALISNKLNLTEIQHSLRVFRFEEKLQNTFPNGIYFENQRILKLLKKLQRSIRILEFKQWAKNLKLKLATSSFIENYHVIYLLSLTKTKYEENQYMFMSLKKNNENFTLKQISKQQNSGLRQHTISVTKAANNTSNYPSLTQQQPRATMQSTSFQKSIGKFRIKSLSYKDRQQMKEQKKQFYQNLQSNLNLSEKKLKEKRKSLTFLSRVKNCFQQLSVDSESQSRTGESCLASRYKDSPNYLTVQNTSRLVKDKRIQMKLKSRRDASKTPAISALSDKQNTFTATQKKLPHFHYQLSPITNKDNALGQKQQNVCNNATDSQRLLNIKVNKMMKKHEQFRKDIQQKSIQH